MRGGLSGWRGALLFVGGWMIYGPLTVWLVGVYLHLHPSHEIITGVGTCIAALGMIGCWSVCHFSHFAVAPTLLQIGRSPRETVIDFSEIESIVVGLPPLQSLLMRVGRHGEMAGAMAAAEWVRRETIYLRLTGGRYLALYVSPVYFANAGEVRTSLVQRNRSKVKGRESYTPEESKRLVSVRINVIRMM